MDALKPMAHINSFHRWTSFPTKKSFDMDELFEVWERTFVTGLLFLGEASQWKLPSFGQLKPEQWLEEEESESSSLYRVSTANKLYYAKTYPAACSSFEYRAF